MELPEINVSMVTQLWVGWDWKGWKCHYRRELNELFRHFVQFLYYENVKKWSLKAVKCGWLSSALVTKKRKSWSCSKKRWRCFIVACFKADSGETENQCAHKNAYNWCMQCYSDTPNTNFWPTRLLAEEQIHEEPVILVWKTGAQTLDHRV